MIKIYKLVHRHEKVNGGETFLKLETSTNQENGKDMQMHSDCKSQDIDCTDVIKPSLKELWTNETNCLNMWYLLTPNINTLKSQNI